MDMCLEKGGGGWRERGKASKQADMKVGRKSSFCGTVGITKILRGNRRFGRKVCSFIPLLEVLQFVGTLI